LVGERNGELHGDVQNGVGTGGGLGKPTSFGSIQIGGTRRAIGCLL
jgi:hypothetical protein